MGLDVKHGDALVCARRCPLGLLTLSKTEQSVLEMLKAKPYISNGQIAHTLSCSERIVSRIVSKLEDLGLVSASRIRYQVGGNWVNQRTFHFKEES